MQRFVARATVAVALLATTACSQTPAPIDLKGGNNYSRSLDNGYNGYGSVNAAPVYSAPKSNYASTYTPPSGIYTNHPVSQATSQNASVESIGVSDLPPPAPKSNIKPLSENLPSPKKSSVTVAKNDVAVKPVAKEKPMKVADSKPSSKGFIWPVNGTKVISGFGAKGPGKANDGINIAASEGEPVWAAADGEVVYSGDKLAGYGNMVLIKHADGKTTSYAHLSRANVDKYDRVKQGDIIGFVGTTGNVKDPQLHFAINDGATALDPRKYLTTKVASN